MAAETRAALRYVAESGSTGYAIAAARLVAAVRDAGVEVEMVGIDESHRGSASKWVAHSRDDPARAAKASPSAPTVMHLVPEHLIHVKPASGGPLIVHTVWETDRIPARWPPVLRYSDGLIVPTQWNRETFAACGVGVPIEVVPHVVCSPSPAVDTEQLGIPDDLVVFYAISRWDERKLPSAAVRAFCEAFTADDPVLLAIKTGRLAEMPPPDGWRGSAVALTTAWRVASVLREYPHPPRIKLWVDEWDDSRIEALHSRGDCYVSLCRGEGWGIGSFDACAHGNPVIATGWSGHLAYLEGSPWLVDHDLVPVLSSAPASYAPDQHWAEPRLDHAAQLMRAIAADPASARAGAQPLREAVARDYAAPVVAERFLAALGAMGVL
jgi:glycosyltransferase involved in cell wall biosynthesis